MTQEAKIGYSWLFFMIGLILRLTPALDIIHELMHYGYANTEGIKVIELHWSSIKYARLSSIVTYGGYTGEFMMYGFLVFMFGLVNKPAASFFLGILLVSWFGSFASLDYNQHALRLWGSQEIVTRQLIVWGVWTSICMIILLATYFHNFDIKEKKNV